jgi:hypothetical protein
MASIVCEVFSTQKEHSLKAPYLCRVRARHRLTKSGNQNGLENGTGQANPENLSGGSEQVGNYRGLSHVLRIRTTPSLPVATAISSLATHTMIAWKMVSNEQTLFRVPSYNQRRSQSGCKPKTIEHDIEPQFQIRRVLSIPERNEYCAHKGQSSASQRQKPIFPCPLHDPTARVSFA